MKKPRLLKEWFALTIAPRPQKQIDSQQAYYIALGEFINRFAVVEAQLLIVLCYFAGTDRRTSKALFSGVRIEQASDFIRRLGAARKIGKKELAELAVLLPQLKAITELRNDIVHYGTRFKADRLTVDNQRGIGRTQIRRYTVSAKLLNNARFDLSRILLRLNAVVSKEKPESLPAPMRKTLYGAWRYKPRVKPQKHPQSVRNSSGRAKAKALPRPPAASP